MTDNFIQKFSNNDLKSYKPLDPDFLALPPEVLSIVAKRFEQLTDLEIAQLMEQDDFSLVVPSPDLENEIISEEPIVNKPNKTIAPENPKNNNIEDSDSEQSDDEDLSPRYNLRPRKVSFNLNS